MPATGKTAFLIFIGYYTFKWNDIIIRFNTADAHLGHQLLKQYLQQIIFIMRASNGHFIKHGIDFFTIDGKDLCRISIDPSDHPVYETRGEDQLFWWRTPVGTDRITDPKERDRLIARRWGA